MNNKYILLLFLLVGTINTSCNNIISDSTDSEKNTSTINIQINQPSNINSRGTLTDNYEIQSAIVYISALSPTDATIHTPYTYYIKGLDIKDTGTISVQTAAEKNTYTLEIIANPSIQDDHSFRSTGLGVTNNRATSLFRYRTYNSFEEIQEVGKKQIAMSIGLSEIKYNDCKMQHALKLIEITDNSVVNVKIHLNRLLSAITINDRSNIEPGTGVSFNGLTYTVGGFTPININKIVPFIETYSPGKRSSIIYPRTTTADETSVHEFIIRPIEELVNIENNKVISLKEYGKKAFTLEPKYITGNGLNFEAQIGNKPNHKLTTAAIIKIVADQPFYAKYEDNHWNFYPYDGVESEDNLETKYFPDSCMYYTYYIRYLDGPEYQHLVPPGETLYAIERNKIYNIQVNSISYPGSRYPGGDIENPLDDYPIMEHKTYNTMFQMTLKEWENVDIDLDLGS